MASPKHGVAGARAQNRAALATSRAHAFAGSLLMVGDYARTVLRRELAVFTVALSIATLVHGVPGAHAHDLARWALTLAHA